MSALDTAHCTRQSLFIGPSREIVMSQLHVPKFYIAHIAAATGLSANTIRQWYKRDVLTIGDSDTEAESIGLARSFSGATALTIAIMGELIKLGTPPNLSASAALKFAHSGNSERLPGHLFPNGETLLVVSPTKFDVINVDADTKLSSIFELLKTPVILLELDDLVHGVRGKLGLGRDPLEPPKQRVAASEKKSARPRAKVLA